MNTSVISGITGYIPELWTRMTSQEIKNYVDGNESSASSVESSLHSPESTQQEMSPIEQPGELGTFILNIGTCGALHSKPYSSQTG